MPQYPVFPDTPRRLSNLKSLWLAALVLVLSSLACMNTQIDLKVSQVDTGPEVLEIHFEQYLTESFIKAAEQVNQERKADFAAAGRETDLEDLLPTSRDDIAELFNADKLQEQGFTVTNTETGVIAEKVMTLEKDLVIDGYVVRIIKDPDHPGLITYRVKVRLDLSNLEDGDLFELRSAPSITKPDLNPEGTYTHTGDFLGGFFSSIAASMQQEMAIELYYLQKALKASDPIEYRIRIELPGTIIFHKLAGETAGSVSGSQVELVIDENTLSANAGTTLVFHVESVLKDCTQACDEAYHLVWDGDEDGASCNCICEAGWTKIEGENACLHCDTVCGWSDPNLVRDLAACKPDQCACQCGEGTVLNNAGTSCISEYDAWVEDQQRAENGGPSPQELADVFAALLDADHITKVNLLPGWYLLTSDERSNLVEMVELLGIAVDRSQLIIDLGPEMTPEERIQQIEEEKRRLEQITEMAINQLEDQIANRRRIQEVIIQEIGGNFQLGQYLLQVPDWYQKLHQSPRTLATEYVKGQLTGEVKKRILQETHGGSPETYSAAAAELIKQIPYLATNSSVDDYYLYKTLYQSYCSGGCGSEDDARLAHEMALADLVDKVGPNRVNWSKPGDAYDRAFWTLNYKLGK